MEQIIYISTARTEPDQATIDSILNVSRRNNRRDGLTGLLVVGGRRFLQVLEGPRAMTDQTYRRIRADDRHFAMVELSRKLITEREFGDWDMGFGSDRGETLREMVDRLTDHIRDPNLQAQFRTFAAMHGKAA